MNKKLEEEIRKIIQEEFENKRKRDLFTEEVEKAIFESRMGDIAIGVFIGIFTTLILVYGLVGC